MQGSEFRAQIQGLRVERDFRVEDSRLRIERECVWFRVEGRERPSRARPPWGSRGPWSRLRPGTRSPPESEKVRE